MLEEWKMEDILEKKSKWRKVSRKPQKKGMSFSLDQSPVLITKAYDVL